MATKSLPLPDLISKLGVQGDRRSTHMRGKEDQNRHHGDKSRADCAVRLRLTFPDLRDSISNNDPGVRTVNEGTRVGTGQISGHTESPTAIEVVVRPWSEAETFRLHFRLPVLA
jgi:hypothetical protein